MSSWKKLGLGGGFLTAESIGDSTIHDTIADLTVEEYDGQPQLVAHLLTKKAKVAFNQHSCKLWEQTYGEDYEGWMNQPIKISLQMVKIMNKMSLIKVLEPTRPPAAPARKGRK